MIFPLFFFGVILALSGDISWATVFSKKSGLVQKITDILPKTAPKPGRTTVHVGAKNIDMIAMLTQNINRDHFPVGETHGPGWVDGFYHASHFIDKCIMGNRLLFRI